MRAPLLYRAYVALTFLALPVAALLVTRKLRRALVPKPRPFEIRGYATEERASDGSLIWFHAASVGESLSVLSLIGRMGDMLPHAHFLITSGTATSAELVARRMPDRCTHQFAPLDAPTPLRRFLDHWRPTAAIFVESELWPQMLRRTHARGARLALVNARLSERSREGWKKYPETAAYVLSVFDLILSQNDAMAQAMVEMHAPPERVARGFNLKALSDPLPKDPATMAQVRTALRGRPVWVAASTHAGEEKDILAAHARLFEANSDLLLILVPRHPDRSAEVARLIARTGLNLATRSKDELPADDTSVYLADTLGELGSWYALTDIVFLGGSMQPVGGHNPFEVAQADAAVLSGPHVHNFSETFEMLSAHQAVIMVQGAEELADEVERLLNDKTARARAVEAARATVADSSAQLDAIARRLIHALALEA
ncbi:MAG: 3-deoxy-D-manno-octulosonic acid transferase [Pseudomonadota bacterium]